MFTGLIKGLGEVIDKKPGTLKLRVVKGNEEFVEVEKGESIAVNGACLTVEKVEEYTFTFSLSRETEQRTNLSYVKTGDIVNLERAMKAYDRFGGHFVQGHVDDKGILVYIRKNSASWRMAIKIPDNLLKYVVEKGSIAVNGVSLTVSEIKGRKLIFDIIPETYENTNFKYLTAGSRLNIEVDVLGKYVERFVKGFRKRY